MGKVKERGAWGHFLWGSALTALAYVWAPGTTGREMEVPWFAPGTRPVPFAMLF